MAFNNDFTTTGPQGSSQANQIDTFIRQDTKAALAERINLEHFTIDDTGESNMVGVNDQNDPQGEGRAIAGKIGCLGYGTSAERELLDAAPRTNCGIGALWVNTDESTIVGITYPAGTMLRYTTSGWEPAQLVSGVIYATDEEAAGDTPPQDKAINAYQLQQSLVVAEDEHIVVSHSITNISQSTPNDYIYTLADFSGAGYDEERVRGVYVRCTVSAADPNWAAVYGEFPWGFDQLAAITAAGDGSDSAATVSTVFMPIESTATQFTLRITAGANTSGAFEIVALKQMREWEVV